MESPCKDCEKKGCGSYHDICEAYQKYVKYQEEKRERIKSSKDNSYSRSNYISEAAFRSRSNKVFASKKG